MIQSMNRFLLDRISFDFKQLSPNSAQLEKVCHLADSTLD